MDATTILLYAAVAVAGVVVGSACVHLVWRAVGVYRIRKAGPRPLRAARHVLWRDPGPVGQRDLASGPGGPDGGPRAPFRFAEEHLSGSQPCVSVVDAGGRRWRVKWGDEVRSETFAVRLAWAVGYFAEVTWFIPRGRVEGAAGLTRAGNCVRPDGTFTDARFELDDPAVRKLFEEHSWAWTDNPFAGTRELNGLKVLVMLLSNWDTKDRRDVARGSNTAIFEHRLSPWRREAHYLISDWGGSMGRWGSNMVTRARWDPAGFEAQTPQFVTGVAEGLVQFGYTGQRTGDIASGIGVDDVRWLYGYLRQLTDAQLVAGLTASGASPEECETFRRALRERITQLARAISSAAAAGS